MVGQACLHTPPRVSPSRYDFLRSRRNTLSLVPPLELGRLGMAIELARLTNSDRHRSLVSCPNEYPRVKADARFECFRNTNTRIRTQRSGFRCELGRSGRLHLQLGAAQTKQNCSVFATFTASSPTTHRNTEHAIALESADLATPDGALVAWVLRRIGHRDQERINGPDLMWNRI